MSYNVLAAGDFDRIQDYLFYGWKLKTIRAASCILADMDNKISKLPEQLGLSNEKARIIYCKAGSFRALFDSEDTAKKFFKSTIRIVRESTVSGTMTFATANASGDPVKDYETIAYELNRSKNRRFVPAPVVIPPFLKTCSSCAEEYASTIFYQDNDISKDIMHLCSSCLKKFQYEKAISGQSEVPLQLSIIEALKQDGYHIAKDNLKDFESIGKHSIPRNFLALVVADGDSAGELFSYIIKNDGFDSAADFSRKLYNYQKQAIINALKKISGSGKSIVPFQVLYGGGDDIAMILPGSIGIEFSAELCREFVSLQRNSNQQRILTMSAGTTIAKTGFPIHTFFNIAKELCSSAKHYRRLEKLISGKEPDSGYIDFLQITEPSVYSLDDYRARLTYEPHPEQHYHYRLYAGPYRIDKNNSKYPYAIDDLINYIKQFKKSKFPRTRLKKFNMILQNFSFPGNLEFRVSKERIKVMNKQHGKLLDKFLNELCDSSNEKQPWIEVQNNKYSGLIAGSVLKVSLLADVVRFYDFIKGGE